MLKKDSVGTFYLQFEKDTTDIWPTLIFDGKDVDIYNPKIWYELEDTYPSAMKKFLKKHEKIFD